MAGFTDEDGTLIPRPAGHPHLRMTRTLAPGMVVTIEPGIYFIPTLLAKAGKAASSRLPRAHRSKINRPASPMGSIQQQRWISTPER